MNALEIVNRIQKISKYFVVLLVLLNLVSMSASQNESGATKIKDAMEALCRDVITVFGAAIILMIVLAAIVYTAGQIMGAETRARANVWATAMITGAIIGAIIYVIAPFILAKLVGAQNYSLDNPCTFNLPGAAQGS